MEAIQDVAHWFLNKQPMMHKKLQKLCYYAQAWYCALYNKGTLFSDEIEAWVHGPVIPTLHALYEGYGWDEIPAFPIDPHMPEDVVAVLNAVLQTYGDLTGDQLESLTHSEDPFRNARAGLDPWMISHNVITCESMQRFYANLYKVSEGGDTPSCTDHHICSHLASQAGQVASSTRRKTPHS